MSSQALTRKRLDAILADIRDLPSIIGQLACLAGYRDPNSGIYSHPSILDRNVHPDVHRELRLLHEAIFRQWMNLPLEVQKRDLDVHFSSLACDRATAIRTWATLESYRFFVPATASTPERQLFLSNLETLLRIEMAEISGVAPDGAQLPLGMEILTIKEASDLLRVPARTIRFWAELGEIPAVKAGRQWRFQRRDIEDWLVRPRTARKNR